MKITQWFYTMRLWLLVFGFGHLLRFAGLINSRFGLRLSQTDFSFLMTSKEGNVSRYFVCKNGKLRTGTTPVQKEFSLVWRDNSSGGKAMMDLLFGKPKALYNALINGVLTLEGEGARVAWFLETINRLNRVFRPKKKAKPAGLPKTV